jgi:2-polyprenyl-3-methyl-5-hydroxy-6-metoxy-1,4-benzoquinol methylase
MNNDFFPWHIGSLPFIVKPQPKPTNSGDIPDLLPFTLDIDEKTGTLIQFKNAYIAEILSKAYKAGSEISGMMDDHGIGELYAQDFLKFLNNSFKTNDFTNFKILEIGCGTGYLLYQLKVKGAEVIGIEPGIQGQKGAEKFGIPIIQDFFPSPKISGKFDIIILYAILEHVIDPVQFLKEVVKHLNYNGKLVIAVPNDEPYIKSGDLSFLFHEHWSYFTSDTLKQSIAQSNQFLVEIKESKFGGIIYAVASSTSSKIELDANQLHYQIELAQQFKILAQKKIEKIACILETAARNHFTVGIYVPGRAINILSLLISTINLPRLRFFDDNPILYQMYYPGINIPVEQRKDLLKNPPDVLIIFTHSFGKKIKNEIAGSLKDTQILLWEDIFMNTKK